MMRQSSCVVEVADLEFLQLFAHEVVGFSSFFSLLLHFWEWASY